MMPGSRSICRECRLAWKRKGSKAVAIGIGQARPWLTLLISLLFVVPAWAATQKLQWTGPAESLDVIAGYRLYLGTESGTYTTVFDLGLPVTGIAGEFEASVEVPEGQVFYAAIASYREDGEEITWSSEMTLGESTGRVASPVTEEKGDTPMRSDLPGAVAVFPLHSMGVTSGTGRLLTAPRGDPRLFVVEREGLVRIVEGGIQRAVPFLDLGDQTDWVDGGGLISLAFDPGYEDTGHFFVTHTASDGELILTRFTVSDDPYQADPFSGVEILSVLLPYRGNPGGGLAFGSDGSLFVAIGDGGGPEDPGEFAQDGEVLLGKILRLDVGRPPRGDALPSANGYYAVPANNPFLGDENVRDEIWGLGLQNPGHLSVDSRTGDLWIADRGSQRRHEIDWERGGAPGGQNFAWDLAEGTDCQVEGSDSACAAETLEEPVVEYPVTENRCGVVGGFAYRGSVPDRHGEYFFMDGCTGQFWSYNREAQTFADWSGIFAWSDLDEVQAVAMGEGGTGELFLLGSDSGIYKLGSGISECSDGLDNDGDGLTDYPDDPGCADAASALELALCDDGLDNDGDGAVDIDDSECSARHENGEVRSALLTDLTSEPLCGLGAEVILLLPILRGLRRLTT